LISAGRLLEVKCCLEMMKVRNYKFRTAKLIAYFGQLTSSLAIRSTLFAQND